MHLGPHGHPADTDSTSNNRHPSMNTMTETLLRAVYGEYAVGAVELVGWSQSGRRFGGELSAISYLLAFLTFSDDEGDRAIVPGQLYKLMCGAGFSVKEILIAWELAGRVGYVETAGPAVHRLTDLGRCRGEQVRALFEK